MVARRAHNPEVVGSNPSSATTKKHPKRGAFLVVVVDCAANDRRVPGGERADRRRWRVQGGERVAAVEKMEGRLQPNIFSGTATGHSK